MVGALSEFERNLIRERTMAGLQAARSRGKREIGPKLCLADNKKDWFNYIKMTASQ